MNTILYHGSTLQIAHPLCNLGRQNLDFGPGFYVTDSRSQAAEWATRVSIRRGEPGIINRYLVDRDALFAEARTHEGVRPAYHLNKTHWNDIYLDRIDDELTKQWIRQSYELMLSKLPKKLREKYL